MWQKLLPGRDKSPLQIEHDMYMYSEGITLEFFATSHLLPRNKIYWQSCTLFLGGQTVTVAKSITWRNIGTPMGSNLFPVHVQLIRKTRSCIQYCIHRCPYGANSLLKLQHGSCCRKDGSCQVLVTVPTSNEAVRGSSTLQPPKWVESRAD